MKLTWIWIVIAGVMFTPTLPVAGQEAAESGQESTGPAYQVVEASTRQAVALEQLAKDLASCDVVFLGEEHDNDVGHQAQLEIIQALLDQGIDVAISMEMFERDVQRSLDDYVAGRIDEPTFLEDTRPWRTYAKHYRPIIELARARHLPVSNTRTG